MGKALSGVRGGRMWEGKSVRFKHDCTDTWEVNTICNIKDVPLGVKTKFFTAQLTTVFIL